VDTIKRQDRERRLKLQTSIYSLPHCYCRTKGSWTRGGGRRAVFIAGAWAILLRQAGINQSVYRHAMCWTAAVWFPTRARDITLLHGVQTGSRVHPTSYPMGTWGSFPREKAAGAWSWPLTFIQYRDWKWWSHTSTPPYVLIEWCLIFYRLNLF
jgi:hypothetical protein